MSNVNKWNNWYKDLTTDPSSFRYSDTITYNLGATFLSDCITVEDWGTGAGGFKRYRPDAIGVDGSDTPHAEKKYVDLTSYTTDCEGIFMRHVLEHNYEWESILKNVVESASKKICIVIFTPLADTTIELAHNLSFGVDVPDLSLSHDIFFNIINSVNPKNLKFEKYQTSTGYKEETIFYIEK